MRCAQALGIAVKLTLQGQNQFWLAETYYCILVRRLFGTLLPCRAHSLLSPCSIENVVHEPDLHSAVVCAVHLPGSE